MADPENPKTPTDLRSTGASPLIFISHDTRDAELAEAFAKLLSSVSAGVLKSFRSSDKTGTQGIEYGTEWYPKLMTQLGSASDVVCLLTPRSVDRPWILYEAGVAKGRLDTPVHSIALGIPISRASVGPFAQFQNCADDEPALTKLVMQLVSRIPGSEPDREAIQMQVTSFKTRVTGLLESIDKASAPPAQKPTNDDNTIAKLFEEVKVMFQDLPSRLEGSDRSKRRRMRRFHPMMFEEMMMGGFEDGPDPIGILVMCSLFRDDMPWLYEVGLETYKAIQAGDELATERALERFRRVAKMTTRGPWMEDMGVSMKEMDMFMMELPSMIGHMKERMMNTRIKPTTPKK
jgi:TIR domain